MPCKLCELRRTWPASWRQRSMKPSDVLTFCAGCKRMLLEEWGRHQERQAKPPPPAPASRTTVTYWVDREGRKHDITQMPGRYLCDVIRYMVTRAKMEARSFPGDSWEDLYPEEARCLMDECRKRGLEW